MASATTDPRKIECEQHTYPLAGCPDCDGFYFAEVRAYEIVPHACPRCEGTGRVARHANVLGGCCFRCGGTGHGTRRVAVEGRDMAGLRRDGLVVDVIPRAW